MNWMAFVLINATWIVCLLLMRRRYRRLLYEAIGTLHEVHRRLQSDEGVRAKLRSSIGKTLSDLVADTRLDPTVIPAPPEGYRRVYAGLSRPGDLQYCWSHGWEPCDDVGVSVSGFNALAAPVEEACAKCGQTATGQTGEYPCSECGLPTLHDAERTA